MKVEEVARRLKLRAELLRWTTDIERAGRHDAIENGLPPLGQFHAGRYQGDPDEVAIGRRYGLVLRGGLRVLPSRQSKRGPTRRWLPPKKDDCEIR